MRECLRRNQPGPYQIQAAINAVHSEPPTDWAQVVLLYDQLLALTPNPVTALHRAVAVAEVAGPSAGLSIVDDLDLRHYQPFHVVRAELLRRLGRGDEAASAYREAIDRAGTPGERRYLERGLRSLD